MGQALDLARQLPPGAEVVLDPIRKRVELTAAGETRLEESARPLGGLWSRAILRRELSTQVLTALELFHRDREYLVRDQKVQIVDELTGRVMADRQWERGLHQLIEAQEGCRLTRPHENLARISYQRFFRRYLHLAGMTGTAREAAQELWNVYRLQVVRLPTHRPLRRTVLPPRVFGTAEEKWRAVVEQIETLHREGRPVLVGTRSVAASEFLSELLCQRGLPHRLLNARQDQEEAEILAQAGQRGQITVATNMAGRGTDIVLGPGVRELGGLHVIATERHEARRIDRQLFGRCARQGDPGSCQSFASLEDDLLAAFLDSPWGWWARVLLRFKPGILLRMGPLVATLARILTERRHVPAAAAAPAGGISG